MEGREKEKVGIKKLGRDNKLEKCKMTLSK